MTSRFPDFTDSKKNKKLQDLFRLVDINLTSTQYIDAKQAANLMAVCIKSYRDAVDSVRWTSDRFLKKSSDESKQLNLALAAIFDIITNAEYCHNRVVSSSWIYCHRKDKDTPRIYYSFLKQCPICCLDKGLEKRLTGAQHKPTSHHIGEVTTIVSVLLLRLLAAASNPPLIVAAISKQSHDVDAIAFRDDLLVLLEIKSSPLVTFPLASEINETLIAADAEGNLEEYKQHSLIDFQTSGRNLSLFIPHRDLLISMGEKNNTSWPYDGLARYMANPENFLTFLSSWLELYYAYSIPKRKRIGRDEVLAYLVNGWGDEIDSNKTKPGLGRTDDIKKGTYQLLKFGTHYRDIEAKLTVRSALMANLDPLFLRAEYLDDLEDVRWGKEADFQKHQEGYFIAERRLNYLYEAIFTFNNPTSNDPILKEIFDFSSTERALRDGKLDNFIDSCLILS